MSRSDIALSVIQHLRDGVAWCRMLYEEGLASDLVFLHTNPAFQHHTGLCPTPGQRLSELLPGLRNTDEALFDSFARVAAGGPAETLQRFVVALGQWFSGRLYSPQAGDVIAIFSEDSARQLAKQRLATSLAEQHAILDTDLVGLVKTRQRHITWANSAAVALFGYPLAELLGQTTERLYPTKAEFDRFAEIGLPVVRAGGVYRGESQVRLKDGSLRWFLHQATQLTPDSDDHVSSFIDISARVEAEAALLRSEARLSSTFAAMAEGVVLQGKDGHILDANPAAERILGLTRDQLLGRSSVDPQWQAVRDDGSPFPGQDHPGMVVLRTGQPQRGQVMGVAAPGLGQRWISINADPVDYSGASQADAVVATFTDITERRRIENELAIAADELRDLYDNAPCGYHSLDAEGRVLLINATELSWMGRSRDEVIGRRLVEFFPPQSWDVFHRHFPRLLKEGSLSGIEFDFVNADGTLRRVAVSGTVVNDAQGRFLRTRTILHDITAHSRAEQIRLDAVHLEAENAQIRETSRLKSLFIANMSHELKTPLNGVLGAVQLLERGTVKPGTAQFDRFIAQIGSSGRHLSQVIEDVLDHANLEAGRLEFHPQPVDLTQLMREVVDIVQSDLEPKRLTFSIDVDPALGPLNIDPLRLKQVCANFLANAVKFTGPDGAVALRLGAEGPEHFRIEVEDTGIGIAPADLPGLFAEFHQLSTGRTKEYGGTGLGLALTRRLVERQGGSVGVRSTLGAGSVFHAVLPRDTTRYSPNAVAPR